MPNPSPRAQARSSRKFGASFTFLAGLVGAAALALSLDQGTARSLSAPLLMGEQDLNVIAARRALTPFEKQAAATAWRYIVNNTDPSTGLVNSVDGFASTTMWDQGSYFLGLVSAHRLGLIDQQEFTSRARRALESLAKFQLFDDLLPNKAYNTADLAMVNYANEAIDGGIGWSALDIARLLIGMEALRHSDETLAVQVSGVFRAWDLYAMVEDGALMGARVSESSGMPERVQEGRIGYEQYGARAAAMHGLDTLSVVRAAPWLSWRKVSGQKVATDARRFVDYGAITPVVSEPYVLMALEIGLDSEARVLASRVFLAQAARFRRDGTLTAMSEDHIDVAPHFLYGSVFANGQPWAVIDETGEHFPELRTFSTKAAFAWSAIYDTPYSDKLREGLAGLSHPEKGWSAGRYEHNGQPNTTLTLNTNAVILEALHFVVHGPILSIGM